MPSAPHDPPTALAWPPFAGRPGQACTDEDAEKFYPKRHGDVDYAPAQAICRRCALLYQCRDWALNTGQQHGVWGGMTPRERRTILRHGGP